MTIKCEGAGVDFTTRRFAEGNESALLGEKESWIVDGQKYYKRTFKTVISPADINYGSPVITVTAKDKSGNEGTAARNILGDKIPSTVDFNAAASSIKVLTILQVQSAIIII